MSSRTRYSISPCKGSVEDKSCDDRDLGHSPYWYVSPRTRGLLTRESRRVSSDKGLSRGNLGIGSRCRGDKDRVGSPLPCTSQVRIPRLEHPRLPSQKSLTVEEQEHINSTGSILVCWYTKPFPLFLRWVLTVSPVYFKDPEGTRVPRTPGLSTPGLLVRTDLPPGPYP